MAVLCFMIAMAGGTTAIRTRIPAIAVRIAVFFVKRDIIALRFRYRRARSERAIPPNAALEPPTAHITMLIPRSMLPKNGLIRRVLSISSHAVTMAVMAATGDKTIPISNTPQNP